MNDRDRYEVRDATPAVPELCQRMYEVWDMYDDKRATHTIAMTNKAEAFELCYEMNAVHRRQEQPEIDKQNYEFLDSFTSCVDVDQFVAFLECVAGVEIEGGNVCIDPSIRDATNRVVMRWLRDNGHLPVAKGVHRTRA